MGLGYGMVNGEREDILVERCEWVRSTSYAIC
jgi:hypothetical protein